MLEHTETSRVLLTRIEEDGNSSFVERIATATVEYDDDRNPIFKGTVLWGTADGIPSVGKGQNPDLVSDTWFPGPGGVRFVFFTFLPKTEGAGGVDRYRVDEMSAESEMPGLAESFDPARPGMHISDTVDFVTVLSGEMYMVMDNGETLMKAGDAFVMRGGWHAWRNESDSPCTVAGVLVGAHREDTR